VRLNQISQRHKWLVFFLSFGIWALLQYQFGNKLYILFMVAILFTLTLLRRSQFTLVAVVVATIVFSKTPVPDTLTKLWLSNLVIIQNIKPSLANVFTPNSGQEVLSVRVRRIIALLQTNHITEYQFSKGLEQEGETKQRVIESAWPIRFNTSSRHFLYLTAEELNPVCVEIDRNMDVVLAYCP